MKMTIETYLDLTKVIRMLYGLEAGRAFFEKNSIEFVGKKLDAKLLNSIKVD